VAPAIEAVDLARAFSGRRALDGLSLSLEAGEVLGLLGPNGAGKTTAIRLLDGVLRPDRGHSRVLGLDPVTQGDALRRRTGVLTEEAGLDDRLTARENLAAAAAIRGLRGREAVRRTTEVLDQLGMGDRADVRVQGASTGQRKRIALARALLHRPELVFLDEPTAGLDPSAARDVVDLLTGLAAASGATVVVCTHLLGEAARLATRVAVLDRGRVRAFGPPAELAADLWPWLDADLDLGCPASPAVVALVAACAGVLDVHPSADGARLRVCDRHVLPTVVAALVGRRVPVFAAVPRPASLEDVYFALQDRVAG
jgi:ABC-2 type transport system ATP-binding protein